MRRSIPILLVSGTATTLALAGCNASNPTAQQPAATATPPPATATTAASPRTAATAASHQMGPSAPTGGPSSGTFQGPSEDMQWGPVQVTIVVKNRRITNVQATAPTERARSAYINGIAVPMLRQEVLKAQSANIYGISGATMTSEAFYYSLQAALQQAHL